MLRHIWSWINEAGKIFFVTYHLLIAQSF